MVVLEVELVDMVQEQDQEEVEIHPPLLPLKVVMEVAQPLHPVVLTQVQVVVEQLLWVALPQLKLVLVDVVEQEQQQVLTVHQQLELEEAVEDLE